MRSEDNFTSDGQFKNINWNAEKTPAHWMHNEPILSYWGNTYIIITAEIERFTIRLSQSIIDEIKDDQLKLEWSILIKEERAHAYQHTCVTEDLKRHHYPIDFMKKYSKLAFGFASRKMNTKNKLALVLVMEFVAHQFSIACIESNMYPINELAIYDFIRWHAEEEMSHFDLCRKVYQHFGGGYFRRIAMLILFGCFVLYSIILFCPIFFFVDIYQGRKIKFKNFYTAFSYMYGFKGLLWSRLKPSLAFLLPR